jgi:hypothetical protein
MPHCITHLIDMGNIINFMRSPFGRVLRFALGLFLIWYGFFGGGGTLVGIIGFVPLLAGGVNACLFAPVLGYSIWGDRKTR